MHISKSHLGLTFNLDDWYCKETLNGHTSTVWGVATDPSGDRFASVSDDKRMIIWKRHQNSGDFHADGSPMEWKQVTTLSGYHERTIFSVDWSNKDNLLVTGAADDAIRIFKETSNSSASKPTFELIFQQFNAHASDVNCVRWSPDANSGLLASAGDDSLIHLWKLVIPTQP
jgi:WD40 repeat protein